MPTRPSSHTRRDRFLALAASSIALALLVPPPALASAGLTGTPGGSNGTALTTGDEPATGSVVLQKDVNDAYASYEQARERVLIASKHSTRISARAERAAVVAQELRRQVQDEEPGGILSSLTDLLTPGRSDLEQAADAAVKAQKARLLASNARRAVAEAIAQAEQARLAWRHAMSREGRLEKKRAAELAARTASEQADFRRGYSVADPTQDALNRKALRRWQRYLSALGDAGIVPPRAKELTKPDRLTGRLDPVRDKRGRMVPGVAEVDPPGAAPIVVLPAETIRAVSEAFSRLGLVHVSNAAVPSAYACGGLVAQAWTAATVLVPDDSVSQWRRLRTVPVAQLQIGDVVILGSERSGLDLAGIYVGNGLMIAADMDDGRASVRQVPSKQVYGAKRVPLPTSKQYAVPSAPGCGAVEQDEGKFEATGVDAVSGTRGGSGPFVLPVPAGSYTLSAGFEQAGLLWSSGQHTGQDFAAPMGTAVYAAAGGVVSLDNPQWAGNLIKIDHGAGVQTWYAHLAGVSVHEGEHVTAGQMIGSVGNEGNSTGPHLHFEVRLDEAPVDPMRVLASSFPLSTATSYANGEIPASALCAVTPSGLNILRCDAAVAFRFMSAAYEADLGTPLCITDSYRSRTGQEQVFKAKPGLAAVPGTSNHGWGIAVDLCGGVERFGTRQHEWLARHGTRFGWHHPTWAAAGGSRPEPWHFEYIS